MYVNFYIPGYVLVVGIATIFTVLFVKLCNRFAADKVGTVFIYFAAMFAVAIVSIFVADVIPFFSYVAGVSWVTAFETALYYWN